MMVDSYLNLQSFLQPKMVGNARPYLLLLMFTEESLIVGVMVVSSRVMDHEMIFSLAACDAFMQLYRV